MQLAAFIDQAEPRILAQAVVHARSVSSLKGQDDSALRDHLPRMLRAISAQLRSSGDTSNGGDIERTARPDEGMATPTAAQSHGLTRAHSGLHLDQVVAEFRALRACVLDMWIQDAPLGAGAVQEILRFDEAIDQALGESVDMYSAEVARWREIFLGVLGHDLRGPLNAIALTAEVIAEANPEELQLALGSLTRSVRRMTSLLDALLDYNRAGLGYGMALERTPMDLAGCCLEELEMQRAAMPHARIDFQQSGDLQGTFDGSRVREALANLLSNAVRHGESAWPVELRLTGGADQLEVIVENRSTRRMSESEIEQLFEPLRRGPLRGRHSDNSQLGLGLFIARQIARAHGGDIHGSCVQEDGDMNLVRFAMTFPRQQGEAGKNESATELQVAHSPAPAPTIG